MTMASTQSSPEIYISNLIYRMQNALGIQPERKPTQRSKCTTYCHRVVHIVLILAAIVTTLVYFMRFILATSTNADRKYMRLSDFFSYIQECAQPARSVLVLAAFLFRQEKIAALQPLAQELLFLPVVGQCCTFTSSVTVKRVRYLLGAIIAAVLLHIGWDFVTWVVDHYYSFVSMDRLTDNSQTFLELGVVVTRWKFYLFWTACGLVPIIFSMLPQILFLCYGYVIKLSMDLYEDRLQQLNRTSPFENVQEKVILEVKELIKLRQKVHAFSEFVSDGFKWISAFAFCMDAVCMLGFMASTEILSREPDYSSFGGVVIYGFYLIVFCSPVLGIEGQSRRISGVITNIINNAICHTTSKQRKELIVHLNGLLYSEAHLKPGIKAGGIFYFNRALMFKVFALIATITIVATELYANDEQFIEKVTNASQTVRCVCE